MFTLIKPKTVRFGIGSLIFLMLISANMTFVAIARADDTTLSGLSSPTNLRVTGRTYSSVSLAWDYAPGSVSPAGFILIVKSMDDSGNPIDVSIARLDPGARTYVHRDGLEAETSYTYRIKAYKGDDGFSSWSNEVIGKTKSLPINLSGIFTDTYSYLFNRTIEQSPDNDYYELFTNIVKKNWGFYRTQDKVWFDTSQPGTTVSANRTDVIMSVSNPSQNNDCAITWNYTAHCTGGGECGVEGQRRLVRVGTGSRCGINEDGSWSAPFPMDKFEEDTGGKDFLPSAVAPDTLLSDAVYPVAIGVGVSCGPDVVETRTAECLGSNRVLKKRTYLLACSIIDDVSDVEGLEDEKASRVETCPGSYPQCVSGADVATASLYPKGEPEVASPVSFPGASCARCTKKEAGYDVLKKAPIRVGDLATEFPTFAFDPEYVKNTIKDRLFKPSEPFSPFDDFYVELKLKICPFAGKPAPAGLGFKSRVEVETASGGVETVIYGTPNSFVKSKETATEASYRWNFVGWSNPGGWSNNHPGIARNGGEVPDQKLMEILVDAIVNRRGVWVVVEDSFGDKKSYKMPQLDSCVHAWGPDTGPFKAVAMRGKSISPSFEFRDMVTGVTAARIVNAALIHKEYFQTTDPFSIYYEKFPQYADLKLHDDSNWTLLGQVKDTNKPQKVSSCNARIGLGRLYYFYNSLNPGSSFTKGGGSRSIFIDHSMGRKKVVMHETGHAFGRLSDEYIIGIVGNIFGGGGFNNCVENPDFEYPEPLGTGPLYGDTDWIGCSSDSKYRPSNKSFMNFSDEDLTENTMYNVISCGYIMKEILGKNSGWGYWPACMKMDGVIKPAATVAPAVVIPPVPVQFLPAGKASAYVDLKVNNSDGPVKVRKGETVRLTWSSNGNDIATCASGDFNTGDRKQSGNTPSEVVVSNDKIFTIFCSNKNGDAIASDSVAVTKRPLIEEISPNEIPR